MKQKWYSIYKIIKKEIKTLNFDSKYKSERSLSEQYNVHRVTIKKAIDQLIKDGYLYRVEKRGTFVSKQKFYDSNLLHDKLDYLESKVSDFKFINNEKLGECLNYTKRYFKDEKLLGIEEVFVSKKILPLNWDSHYEEKIGYSLFDFIEEYKLTSINFSKKEINTFINNKKHYIMVNTDIFDYKNELVAITTIIQPFMDFSLKFIDYTNQSKNILQ